MESIYFTYTLCYITLCVYAAACAVKYAAALAPTVGAWQPSHSTTATAKRCRQRVRRGRLHYCPDSQSEHWRLCATPALRSSRTPGHRRCPCQGTLWSACIGIPLQLYFCNYCKSSMQEVCAARSRAQSAGYVCTHIGIDVPTGLPRTVDAAQTAL
jgi:hypothetical protein